VSFDEDPKLAAQIEAANGHVDVPDRARKEKKLLRKLVRLARLGWSLIPR
jgi:hypothetical protein